MLLSIQQFTIEFNFQIIQFHFTDFTRLRIVVAVKLTSPFLTIDAILNGPFWGSRVAVKTHMRLNSNKTKRQKKTTVNNGKHKHSIFIII